LQRNSDGKTVLMTNAAEDAPAAADAPLDDEEMNSLAAKVARALAQNPSFLDALGTQGTVAAPQRNGPCS